MSKFMYPTPVGIANYNDNKTDFKSFIICIEGNRCFPNKNFGKDNYLSDRLDLSLAPLVMIRFKGHKQL